MAKLKRARGALQLEVDMVAYRHISVEKFCPEQWIEDDNWRVIIHATGCERAGDGRICTCRFHEQPGCDIRNLRRKVDSHD